jgi:hypothetical protein
MWEGPFQGHAETTIAELIGDLIEQKPSLRRNNKSLDEIAREVHDWHTRMAAIVERGGDSRGMIEATGGQ